MQILRFARSAFDILVALGVDAQHATIRRRHDRAWPGHLHGMVADSGCIFRNLVRVADGRVKPGHDGDGDGDGDPAMTETETETEIRP